MHLYLSRTNSNLNLLTWPSAAVEAIYSANKTRTTNDLLQNCCSQTKASPSKFQTVRHSCCMCSGKKHKPCELTTRFWLTPCSGCMKLNWIEVYKELCIQNCHQWIHNLFRHHHYQHLWELPGSDNFCAGQGRR